MQELGQPELSFSSIPYQAPTSSSSSSSSKLFSSLSQSIKMSDNIPPEIVQEILSRLPARTLIKLKTVCKAWRYMIEDPSFIRFHLHHQLRNSSHVGHLVFRGSDDGNNSCFLPVESLITKPQIEKIQAIPLDHNNRPWTRFDSDGSFCHLLCSCNGVMLMSHIVGNTVSKILWNPATRETRELPAHTSSIPSTDDDKMMFMSAGFGYDYIGFDYKVVNITQRVERADWGGYESETVIYSLKSDSWRQIEDFPCFTESLSGVYLNGALHWLACSEPLVWMEDLIIGIDLTDESYFQIPIPDEILNKPGMWARELSVLGGCISLTCFHIINTQEATEATTELWVMKKYSEESSWTKLFSIANPGFQYWPVIYSRRKGVVILENRKSSPVEYVILDLDNMMSRRTVTVDGAAFFKGRSIYNLETLLRLNTTKESARGEKTN